MIERSLVVMDESVRGAAEMARLAEEAGFHTVWTTEFYDKDAFVRMTAMGRATTRIGIVPLGAANDPPTDRPVSLHPQRVAARAGGRERGRGRAALCQHGQTHD